jgi:DNA-binding XRE family transcriptional regulator
MNKKMKEYELENNFRYYVKEKQIRLKRLGRNVKVFEIFNDIEKETGMTFSNIKSIYHNKTNPSIFSALLLAKYFRVNVEDIFNIEYEKEND